MTERKYALHRIEAGDYLLPSNDEKTIWRLRTYQEVEASEHDTDHKEVTRWAVYKWAGGSPAEMAESIVDGDWDPWPMQAGYLRTRAEAIAEAMRMSA